MRRLICDGPVENGRCHADHCERRAGVWALTAGHIGSFRHTRVMDPNNAPLRVYFSCPSCEAIYSATQKRKPSVVARFVCKLCNKTVHRWWGTQYSYRDWEGPLYKKATLN